MSVPCARELRGLPRDKANDAGPRRPPLLVAGTPDFVGRGVELGCPADHAGRWEERASYAREGWHCPPQRLHSGRWEGRCVDNKGHQNKGRHAGRWQAQAHVHQGKPRLSTNLHEGRWQSQGHLQANEPLSRPTTAVERQQANKPMSPSIHNFRSNSSRSRSQVSAVSVDYIDRCEHRDETMFVVEGAGEQGG
jgi:hypothetical protein